ncbi:MAG: O-antigen ligase family protein [Limisphaerales bacterium]
MSSPSHSNPHLWRHYPWLLGLLLAPLLMGSVEPEQQAIVGCLLAASWLLLSDWVGGPVRPCCPLFLQWSALALLLLPVLPLPLPLVEWLSPQRAALARNFPIIPGSHTVWLPLTVSPANTLQRLWEFCLLITCFGLARHAASEARFPRIFAMLLGTAVLLLAASDVWYRLDPEHSPLGFWKPSWRDGAGTFVNRNDFADWVYVATLCAAGWVFRSLKPLHDARSRTLTADTRCRGDAVFLGCALSFGLIRAVVCGSRGGILALLVGVAVWTVLLARRSRNKTRLLVLGLLAILALAAMLSAGDLVLRRLAGTKQELVSEHSKLELWRQSLLLFLKFPLLGTGWGSFVTAFNHFKTVGGLSTFWHSENDYVQLLVETGLAGVVVFGGALWCLLRALTRFVWRERIAEPEMVFGAFAALIAFGAHAIFEFVFEISANALLAAALLGFCVGSRDPIQPPAVPPLASRRRAMFNMIWAISLMMIAALQGLAAWHWHQARHATSADVRVAEVRRSVRLWPWASDRQIGLARAEMQRWVMEPAARQIVEAERLHAQMDRALAWDPFNWELRLERAWLDLAFSTNPDRARAETWETARLNPLQPEIPLRFANYFAYRDPDMADALLQSADLSSAGFLQQALSLAWRIRHDPEQLWKLTPSSVEGLLTLGDFAVGQKLLPLAAHVYQQLTNRTDPVLLAEKFLQAQRPDLALSVIPQPPVMTRAKLLLARSHFEAGHYAQAITAAESVWQDSPVRNRLLSSGAAVSPTSPVRSDASSPPTNARTALGLAENVFRQPAEKRDLVRLRQWHIQFPNELRLTWIIYQTELALEHYDVAAQVALQLASQIAAQK